MDEEALGVLKEIREETRQINVRLGAVETRLESIDTRLGSVELRMGFLEKRTSKGFEQLFEHFEKQSVTWSTFIRQQQENALHLAADFAALTKNVTEAIVHALGEQGLMKDRLEALEIRDRNKP